MVTSTKAPDARIFGRNIGYITDDLKKATRAQMARALSAGVKVVGRVIKGDIKAIKDLDPVSVVNVARYVGINAETLVTVDLRKHPEVLMDVVMPALPAGAKAAAAKQDSFFAQLRHFKSTVAQNQFGAIMDFVEDGEPVVISRHDAMTAVMVPADEYRRLKETASRKLNLLTQEFDAMVARMQHSDFTSKMSRAFDASPKELGAAAVAAARSGHG